MICKLRDLKFQLIQVHRKNTGKVLFYRKMAVSEKDILQISYYCKF